MLDSEGGIQEGRGGIWGWAESCLQAGRLRHWPQNRGSPTLNHGGRLCPMFPFQPPPRTRAVLTAQRPPDRRIKSASAPDRVSRVPTKAKRSDVSPTRTASPDVGAPFLECFQTLQTTRLQVTWGSTPRGPPRCPSTWSTEHLLRRQVQDSNSQNWKRLTGTYSLHVPQPCLTEDPLRTAFFVSESSAYGVMLQDAEGRRLPSCTVWSSCASLQAQGARSCLCVS